MLQAHYTRAIGLRELFHRFLAKAPAADSYQIGNRTGDGDKGGRA